jgi:MscS family membrane protein
VVPDREFTVRGPEMKYQKRFIQIVVGIAATVCCLQAVAQDQPEPLPASVPTPVVDPDHRSPRATMATFLGAFYEEPPDLAAASACLDLGELSSEIRRLHGRELAVQLKNVLDRTVLVDLDTVPDRSDGGVYRVVEQASGTIEIGRAATGEWLFTAATVNSLDALWQEVRDRPVLGGVEQTAPEVVTPGTWLRSKIPGQLRSEVLFLEVWQWIGILLIIFVGVAVGRVFSYVVTGAIARFFSRRATAIDRDGVIRALQPLGVLVMVVVWGLGIIWLGLPMRIFILYYKAVKVIAVAAAAFSAYRFSDVVSDVMSWRAERTETQYDDMLVPLVRKSLKIFVAAAGLLTVAQVLGTDLTALIASVGIGGLALALAAQDTVSNFFGSLMVFMDRPFQVGDWVKTGDVEGTVEEVGFRSTRIRTFYNSLITLPNSNLIKASVDNLGDRTYRRWSTRLGIAYNTPPERIDAFCEGIRELVRQHPHTRKDYYHVYFNEFGADSLQILVYVFFFTPDWATELRERHRLGVDIIRLAAELQIEFAFPTQTLYLRREDWEAPASAGDGYPKASSDLQDRARKTADCLVHDAIGDEIPPPVEFAAPTEQNGGDV